ncbi:MAG: hypothetical protein KDB23_30050, partial [Planctomycetales bacterium]|nr:hypothetical protein [Planctomycetales bacterium]
MNLHQPNLNLRQLQADVRNGLWNSLLSKLLEQWAKTNERLVDVEESQRSRQFRNEMGGYLAEGLSPIWTRANSCLLIQAFRQDRAAYVKSASRLGELLTQT